MVAREPGELPAPGETFYRLLPEGRLTHFDGLTVRANPDREGLDFNRNFPSLWRQEHEQLGAGPYPASEPEVRAMVDFVVRHANIGAAVSFHTHSGVILRPMGTEPDEAMIPEDLWLYQRLSKLGERLTGYPAISIWHEFKYHPKEVISGTQDWLYEHLGALFELAPEVVVLSTGAKQMFPRAALRAEFATRRIGLEVMEIGAACRTYNVLVGEERKVLGAILLPSPEKRSE